MSSLALDNEAAVADVKKRTRTDHHLWGTYIVLVIFAIVELFSASIQEVNDGDVFSPLVRHGRFIIFGFVLMLVMQRIPYRYLFSFIPVYVCGCLGLMTYVLFFGTKVNGAMRAIMIGSTPVLPAELMKLAAALGVAWILNKFKDKKTNDVSRTGWWMCIIFTGACCGLLITQGLSNTIVTFAICMAMMWVGGMGLKKFALALCIMGALGGGVVAAKTAVKKNSALTPRQEMTLALNKESAEETASGRGETWRKRMFRHWRPNKHLEAFSVENQQEQLSYIAQANGGLFGVGIGKSRENARLPLAFSDYIFAIIVEELGLFRALLIPLAFMWILGRSAHLALSFKHTEPGALVMGCAFVVVFQALFHMCIVSGVVPVSGQPLPLISKGGISVVATSMAFGVMLSAARHATRKSDELADNQVKAD
ncbi:MAG: FtsW/RodA/SpoVE family cell cycle protein [Bacteroidales bacterium]|nr:FtsW/RodA/SpoVE family cell cycle protein [Bacteroidales bacterium]